MAVIRNCLPDTDILILSLSGTAVLGGKETFIKDGMQYLPAATKKCLGKSRKTWQVGVVHPPKILLLPSNFFLALISKPGAISLYSLVVFYSLMFFLCLNHF